MKQFPAAAVIKSFVIGNPVMTHKGPDHLLIWKSGTVQTHLRLVMMWDQHLRFSLSYLYILIRNLILQLFKA